MTGNTMPDLPSRLRQNRIGIMSCSWKDLDFATHCRESARLDVGYIEDFAHRLDEERIPLDTARSVLADSGLPLLLVIARDLDVANPSACTTALARDCERWRRIGLSTFVTLRARREVDFDAFLRCLEGCGETVRAAGLTPLAQNHRGGRVESPEELLACAPTGVGLHFDTQQFPWSGHDSLEAWNLLGSRIVHAHLGDRDVDSRGVPFGSGVAHLAELLRRMQAGGYRGGLTIETEYGPNDAAGAGPISEAKGFIEAQLAPFGALGCAPGSGHAALASAGLPLIETDWGSLHWIANASVFAGCGQTLGLVTIKPGHSNGAHRHPADEELILVQRGRCRHRCGGREVLLEAGDVLRLPPGQPHQATNIGEADLELLVAYPCGSRSFESISLQEASL
jgi:sugar phosphate isomerase/epimerase/mannose-6-phosphate isomerase-like protein (cupin superfamily)